MPKSLNALRVSDRPSPEHGAPVAEKPQESVIIYVMRGERLSTGIRFFSEAELADDKK